MPSIVKMTPPASSEAFAFSFPNLLLLQIEVGLIFSASPRSERWPRGSRNRCLRIFWTVPVPRVLEIDVRGKFFLNVEIVKFLSFRTALLYQGKVLQRHARHTLLLSLGRDNDGTVDEEPVCVLRLIGLCPHHLQNFRDPSDVSVSPVAAAEIKFGRHEDLQLRAVLIRGEIQA